MKYETPFVASVGRASDLIEGGSHGTSDSTNAANSRFLVW
jgi:hypothetical protein